MQLTPLHVKSHHSWCAGLASPEQLAARAAEQQLSALALTDVENLHGQPRFHELCRNAGIRPITGVELRRGGRRDGRIVVLARDAQGYANLCRIVSQRRAGADCERALAGDTRGLFVLTDDPRTLARLLAAGVVARGDLRLLLVRPASRDERPIHEAAARYGVPLVADPEVVLLDASDHRLHALLVAALGNRRLTELAAAELEPAELWFRSPEQQLALFADVPQAIEENLRVAESCRFEFTRERSVLPGADAFGGTAPELALERRCHRTLHDAQLGPEYATRLAAELAVICELGYAGYFLAAAEIIELARERDIAIAARGSAVGSLVVHLLGMSPINPITHGLHFERFLHAQRKTPPDIDLDVCSERRDELVRAVTRRFGHERVALVGTLPTFQFDSAIRAGLRALDTRPALIERFMAAIDRFGAKADGDRKYVPPEALELLPIDSRQALPLVLELIGKPRSLAMHPGGVVIANRAIREVVPVERGRAGFMVAQHDKRAIEQTGLTKLDLLGNRFLTQLQRARALAGGAAPRLHECPLDDAATLARIDRADTLGCFQIETPLVRTLLTQMPVRSLDDCAAALALVRPGASAGAAKRAYLRSRNGNTDVVPPPLYDEDLLDLLRTDAGLSLAAADQLRADIIAGRDLHELVDWQHADARARTALARAGQFAAYSFCKAHALSHALLAYQSAYFKTHHRAEWGCALLDSYGGAYPLRTIAADLQRAGVVVLGPSVNRSAILNTLDDSGAIVLGLSRIKHLRKQSAMAILEARSRRGDYRSMDDLTSRVRLAARELRALVLCGACDQFAPVDPQQLDDVRALVRIRNELDFLEMHLTDHPLRVLRAEAHRHGCMTLARAQAEATGAPIRFAGLLAASRRHRVRSGVIDYLTFEDESGLLEAIIPPHAFARLVGVMTTPGPYLAEGRLRDDQGHRHVEIAWLCPFHERNRSRVQLAH